MNTYFNTLSKLSNQKIELAPNEILYQEGSRAGDFFGISQGNLIVYKNTSQSKFLFPRFIKSGEILPLNTLKSGTYKDTAHCISLVRAFMISHATLKNLIDEDIQLRLLIMQEMCKEINKVETLDLNHYNKSLKQKTAHLLLEMIKTYGADKPIPEFCYQLIPLLLQASDKAWNRVLDELSNEGIINKQNSQILVTNTHKIKKIV